MEVHPIYDSKLTPQESIRTQALIYHMVDKCDEVDEVNHDE